MMKYLDSKLRKSAKSRIVVAACYRHMHAQELVTTNGAFVARLLVVPHCVSLTAKASKCANLDT